MPIRLTREYRFFWNSQTGDEKPANSWSGSTPSLAMDPFLNVRTTVSGPVDRRTGYLINIQEIDLAIASCLKQVKSTFFESRPSSVFSLIRELFRVSDFLPVNVTLEQVELVITPYLSLQQDQDVTMTTLTQQFEFSAAHRLHAAHLSDLENREYFGKCNNPAGHGHNYVVAITVRVLTSQAFSLKEFESQVRSLVIDYLDHKHLNVDIPEFATLNPTVENICQVIWSILSSSFPPGFLTNVRVYETPKTWADFPG